MPFGGYTDDELLASARDYAFNGLINITGIDNMELRLTLIRHFSKILEAIDAERAGVPTTGDEVR